MESSSKNQTCKDKDIVEKVKEVLNKGDQHLKMLLINITSLIIGYFLYTLWQTDKYRQDEVDITDYLGRVINQY